MNVPQVQLDGAYPLVVTMLPLAQTVLHPASEVAPPLPAVAHWKREPCADTAKSPGS